MPSECSSRCARSSPASRSAAVTAGNSRPTRCAAPSCSMPLGTPSASRSIRPSTGSALRRSIPASSSALLFTQAPWWSRLTRYTGRSGTTASSSSRVGMPPANAASAQPPPETHGSSGRAAAWSATSRR
ncbi:MAG: hypothetical protein QOD82_7117 [Pseudonocardiales bacterium]|nr:hypothetical protein [Pseudonocardiales bacterium]